MSDIERLQAAIRSHWSGPPGEKAARYIGQFFDCTRTETKIIGKVVGNHGTYIVTVDAKSGGVTSACSCYIGKGGYCHHCTALAYTFVRDPGSFLEIRPTPREAVGGLPELQAYLAGVTLAELLAQLKAHGITQKAFAEGIGMSTQHLGAIKSAEARNHFYHELGATKLAALWVMEHLGKLKAEPSGGANL
jgi:uncharacterized Zn finger protein